MTPVRQKLAKGAPSFPYVLVLLSDLLRTTSVTTLHLIRPHATLSCIVCGRLISVLADSLDYNLGSGAFDAGHTIRPATYTLYSPTTERDKADLMHVLT